MKNKLFKALQAWNPDLKLESYNHPDCAEAGIMINNITTYFQDVLSFLQNNRGLHNGLHQSNIIYYTDTVTL